MTEEQIKQNAEIYAEQNKVNFSEDKNFAVYDYDEQKDAYIAGAHSRDEEIKELKRIINEQDSIICSLDCEDKVSIIKERDKLVEENVKLRNPWISVEDRLPEKVNKFISDEVLVRYLRGGKEYAFVMRYDYEYQTWNIPNVTHWMPIPELKKGE